MNSSDHANLGSDKIMEKILTIYPCLVNGSKFCGLYWNGVPDTSVVACVSDPL